MSKPTNFLVSNLNFLMGKRGLNPNSLSDHVRNEPPQATIFRIINGESLTPRDSTLQPLADFFGVPIHALRYVDLSSSSTFVDPVTAKELARGMKARRIVVLSANHGDLPERVWNDEGQPMSKPQGFAIIASDDEQAFLVPVLDDSLAPRYNAGEYALVEPGTPPELEDDVLLRLKTGALLLRRLVSRRGGIRVGSYRSPETQLFAEDEVSWLYTLSNPVPARKVTNQ